LQVTGNKKKNEKDEPIINSKNNKDGGKD